VPLAIRKVDDKASADLFIELGAITLAAHDDGTAGIDLDVGSSTLSGAYRQLTGATFRLRRTLTASELAAAERDGFLLLHVNYLPHGRGRRVRFVVRDRATGRLGTVDLPLDCCATLLSE